MVAFIMAKDDDSVSGDAGVDPRKIRRKSKNQRSFDQVKGFTDLEKTEYDKKGKGTFFNDKENYQKKLDKRSKELEYRPFDHDRKSPARSAPIPVLKDKLVPNDLKTPEIKPENKEKITFAKFIRPKRTPKGSKRTKKKEK